MIKKTNMQRAIIASICLSVLILDTNTALLGARNGIDLCLRSILPSLLPFCVLSKLICSSLLGQNIPFLRPIGRLTGMPAGTESILLLSFIGGYPIGAQCIEDAYRSGAITQTDAERLLSFCNNAGPAFLFGILSCLFPDPLPLWLLYMIHILSALLVGIIFPGKSKNACLITSNNELTLPQALEKSLKTIAIVCGWVIIFRIVLQFFDRWFFWAIDPTRKAVIAGILEFSNGCLSLLNTDNLGLRYILCSLFLGFGGCCVVLQTSAVTKHVPLRLYFPGKILQTALSVILAALSQYAIFPSTDVFPATGAVILSAIIGIMSVIITYKSKNVVAIAG